MNVITAEGLVKVYKSRKSEVRALDGVDLAVAEGSVLGLLGPNGAGKTTTVRILATLLKPDAGHATVAGFDVVKQAQELRSVIGLSGQYAAVDENLTGAREPLDVRPAVPAAAAPRRASGPTSCWSSSTSWRPPTGSSRPTPGACVAGSTWPARSSAVRSLLFLDEPTTGLDPRSRLGMWDVIRGLVREGTTLLLTTQYLEEADELADTIAVVDHGKIIARGTADELKTQVGGERIEVVVDHREDIVRATSLIRHFGVGDVVVDAHTRKLTLPSTGGAQTLVQVVSALTDADIVIDDIGVRRPTLDDVFLSLTGHAAEVASDDDETAPCAHDYREEVMTTTTAPTRVIRGGTRQALADGLVVMWRNLKRIPRIPELAIFAVIQSIMFVLLFAFVFGGAIPLPGYSGPNATAST